MHHGDTMTQAYYRSWGRRQKGQENIRLLIRPSVNRSLDITKERSVRRGKNVSLWGSKPDGVGKDEVLDLQVHNGHQAMLQPFPPRPGSTALVKVGLGTSP